MSNILYYSIIIYYVKMDSLIFLAKLSLAKPSLARNIKESIFIRVNYPSLNRNIGKFNLPHIWDMVLLNTPGLKRHAHTVGHVNSNNSNNPL